MTYQDQEPKSWVTRLTYKIVALLRPTMPKPEETTTSGATSVAVGKLKMAYFDVASERKLVYRDAEEMDATVDEVSAALDVLADNSVNAEDGTQGAFWIDFQKGTAATKKLIEDTLTRTKWREKAYSVARDTLLYGDTFLQYVLSKDLRIVRLMYMPPETMQRNEDDYGLLKEGIEPGEAAFEQYEPGTTNRIAWWYPWQIEHLRWNRSGSRKYGRSLLYTARTPWKKWQAMEEALVINWLTRAFARLLFILDVTGKTPKESEAYIKKFAQSLTTRQISSGTQGDETLSVVKDIYIGRTMHEMGGKAYEGMTDVKVLDTSNTGFMNLTAIEYYQNKVLTSLRVPKAHIGLERDVNAKATLQQQDRRFARVLRRIQQLLSEAIAHTIDLQLALQGIDPAKIAYRIMWPSPSWEDLLDESAAVKNFTEADTQLLDRGLVDRRYVQSRHLRMSDSEIARADAEREANIKAAKETETPVAKTSSDNPIDQKSKKGTK
jgi:hypothetical protein